MPETIYLRLLAHNDKAAALAAAVDARRRLFGLRKWAKDTEAAWRKLEAGDYDWAHIAYTIWPARVQEVCRKDRSIAIAHGLEALCEVAVKAVSQRKKPTPVGEVAETPFPDDEFIEEE
jgi:hypothetical protein